MTIIAVVVGLVVISVGLVLIDGGLKEFSRQSIFCKRIKFGGILADIIAGLFLIIIGTITFSMAV